MKTSFNVSRVDIIETRAERARKSIIGNRKSNSKISIGRLTISEINEAWEKTLKKQSR